MEQMIFERLDTEQVKHTINEGQTRHRASPASVRKTPELEQRASAACRGARPAKNQQEHRYPEPVLPNDSLPPRIVELVESINEGRYFLRTQRLGRFLWQAVPEPGEHIPNNNHTWRSDDGTLHQQYWLNHGTFRLARGVYRRIAT